MIDQRRLHHRLSVWLSLPLLALLIPMGAVARAEFDTGVNHQDDHETLACLRERYGFSEHQLLNALQSAGATQGDAQAIAAYLRRRLGNLECDQSGSDNSETSQLSFLAREDFTTWLQAARAVDGAYLSPGYEDWAVDDVADVSAPVPASPGGTDLVSSEVNVQEAGVDEADVMRSDGQYIYAIDRAAAPWDLGGEVIEGRPDAGERSAPEADQVRILEIDPDSLTELTELSHLAPGSAGEWRTLSGLYLAPDGQELILLGARADDPYGGWYAPDYWLRQETTVHFADIRDPGAPHLGMSWYFEGGLVNSRVVEETLYLVTRYYPPYPADSDGASGADLGGVDLLPHVRRDRDAAATPLDVTGCYVEETETPESSSMIVIYSIDLADAEHPYQATCFAGQTETLYSSTRALYLATADHSITPMSAIGVWSPPYEQRTLIHKFAFSGDTLAYRGSGTVPGLLADNPKEASFRFSESASGTDLRVITESSQILSFFEPWGLPTEIDVAVEDAGTLPADPAQSPSPVVVSILRDHADNHALELIGSLPNPQRPEAIGLEGEHLYASRYVGDTAYLITFRTIDPLYVIDLSDPRDPYIAGELKIEGFSDYLHPVGEHWLLGIGKDAYPDSSGGGEARGAWYQGLQIALFDVSDPTAPRTLQREIIGQRGTETSLLWDHLAFAGMQPGEREYRFAFGVTLHDDPGVGFDPDQPWQYSGFTHHGLYRFSIDLMDLSGEPLRVLPPLVTTDEPWGDIATDTTHDRALLIGEAVHFYHDSQFWSQDWLGELLPSSPQ